MSEASPPNAKTAYAVWNVRGESHVAPLAADDFCVTFLRNATAYGASPRIRFDIVLNDLVALAWTTKRIAMTSDGTPWRPIVHIDDICLAVRCALAAPTEVVNGQVFNVGADTENYRIKQLAEIVACLLYTSPSPRDRTRYRMPSSA